MSKGIGEKIRELRESLEMGRAEFSDETGIPKETLIKIEQGKVDPRMSTLLKITRKYTQYAFWLMTDKTHVDAGHLKPAKKKTK